MVGFSGLSEEHKDHYVEKVWSVILGGNMSSRMFWEARSKGSCLLYPYTTDDYIDTGIISTRAGVDVKRINLAIQAIWEEYKRFAEKNFSARTQKYQRIFKRKICFAAGRLRRIAHLNGKQEPSSRQN